MPDNDNTGIFLRHMSKKDLSILFLIGIIGLALSFLFYRSDLKSEEALTRANFETTANRGFETFHDDLEVLESTLGSLQDFFRASNDVTRQEFALFTKRLIRQNPGLQALEWIPRITHDKLPVFIAQAHKDGFTNFEITGKDAEDKLARRSEHAEYFPVYYVEPLTGNEKALGFDLTSDPIRHHAMALSMESGKTLASEQIRLVQDKDEQSGFLIFAPIYSNDDQLLTVHDRREQFIGFIMAIFRTGDFFTKISHRFVSEGFSVRVYEGQSTGTRTLLYSSAKDVTGLAPDTGKGNSDSGILSQRRGFNFWGRNWEVIVAPEAGNPAWQPRTRSSGAILVSMLCFTGLVMGYVSFLLKDRARSKQNITEKAEILQRLDLALKGADLGVWDWHVQTGRVHQDEVWHTQLGYSIDDMEKHITSWENHIHPDDKDAVFKALNDCLEGRSDFYSVEHRLMTKSGDWKWILTRGKVVERDEKGLALRMLGTHLDVDKTKRTELDLREKNELFGLLAETIQDAFWISEPEMKGIQYISPGYEKIWGQSEQELHSNPMSFLNAVHPEDAERVRNVLHESHSEAKAHTIEYRIIRPDGSERWIMDRGYPVFGEDGEFRFLCGTCTDITIQKKSQEDLRMFKASVECSNSGIAIADLDGNLVYVNESLARMHGVSVSECVGRHLSMLHTTARMPVVRQSIQTLFDSGSFQALELYHVHKDGSEFPTLMNGAMILDSHGKPSLIMSTVTDISELKKAQEERHRLATVIEQSAKRIIITDTEGRIVYVNPAFEATTGYDRKEVVGQFPAIISSGSHEKAFFEDMWKTITQGKTWKGQLINRKKDGALMYEQSTISPIRDSSGNITGYVQIARDITEEENLRRQLTQSQKMEAIGTMAGGIAHDFNNIIQAIIGNAELVMNDLPKGSSAHNRLSRVLEAAERSGEMVRQILAFSRQSDQKVSSIDVGPLVREGIKFLRASIPPNIEIEARVESGLGHIMANPTQFHQVLMNLCVNASQAMIDNKGKILVELDQLNVDEDFAACHPPLRPGLHLRLRVSDTGKGIPLSVRNKIFDPYFTTKEPGQGTGLGLAVAQGIVSSFSGNITVDTTEGAGTVFTICIPIVEKEVTESPSVRHEPEKCSVSGNILVVDDEEDIAEIARLQLNHLGHRVTVTTDPDEAFRLFSQDPDQFDLVVTDLMMPEISGTELAEKIRAIRKDVPIIIFTGWNQMVTPKKVEQLGLSAVLTKPMTRDEMAQVIRKILEDRSKR